MIHQPLAEIRRSDRLLGLACGRVLAKREPRLACQAGTLQAAGVPVCHWRLGAKRRAVRLRRPFSAASHLAVVTTVYPP